MSRAKSASAASGRLTRLATPVVGLLVGVAFWVASAAGGHPGAGAGMFGIMAVFSLGVLLAARRSETVRGLLDRRDERISAIDLQATAFSGLVLISAILVGFVVEMVHGRDGSPYTWLGAVAGLSYLAAVVVLRLRR